jgi:pyridinium-3,5-bisthiocarboxylic acid mononucleotide nickel chelatase
VGKTAYLDCFSGASGDMILGALIDAGLSIDALRSALGSLAFDYGTIAADRVSRAGIAATKFSASAETGGNDGNDGNEEHAHPHAGAHAHAHAHSHEHSHSPEHAHEHHSLAEIRAWIERSSLSRAGKDRAVHLFDRLGRVEAEIHGTRLDDVHLHEVGAVDSIVDIVGAVYGFEWLGADEIVASPLNVGSGTVRCAHGTYPVPAPATASLLRGVPIYAGTVVAELVTPTGALLVSDYAARFGPLPQMCVRTIGYGAGSWDFPGAPNVLRLLIGETSGAAESESIVTLECEIDDMNPQLFGPLMERLLASGALDVFYTAVQMKKNRPGTLVTIIATPERREALAGLLFAETTTIGVRYQELRRERLVREVRPIATPLGVVRIKVARRDGRVLNASPEFDDCVAIAAARGIPIKDVQAVATKAWLESSVS